MKIDTNPRATSYRFTIDSLNCEFLQQLKLQTQNTRRQLRSARRDFNQKYPDHARSGIQLPYVRVRARGPRKGQRSLYHTLMKNATHYDIYISEAYKTL